MKSAALLLCVIVCAMAPMSRAADLSQVQSVYLLPMGSGLDQYLANRLTQAGLFQVVADPKKASAVFTERLGEAFEERLQAISPAAPVKTDENEAKDSQTPVRQSSFGGGKGTLFLVDVASRSVLWSTYQKPRNTTPAEMDRTARHIVEQLKSSVKPK
jgi:hypothetical protein